MIREKAPDLAPLAVVLLGDDRDALLAMEESVQGITTRHNTWTPMESQLTIADLETDLDKGRRREAKILADLRAIREQETLRYDAKFGYSGTLAQIAGKLDDEQELLDWITDKTLRDVELLVEFDDPGAGFVTLPWALADAPEGIEPPLSAAQFRDLVSLLLDARVGERESCGWASLDDDGLPIVDIAKLPPVEAFGRGGCHDISGATARLRAVPRAREHRWRRSDFGGPLGLRDRQDPRFPANKRMARDRPAIRKLAEHVGPVI